jgi:hypothetical protein
VCAYYLRVGNVCEYVEERKKATKHWILT